MPTLLLPYKICLTVLSNTETVRAVPNEFILMLISVTIVFLALTCLTGIYILIGKVIGVQFRNRKKHPDGSPTEKEAAAIATALKMYLDEETHDQESYVITIKRK